jgi:hypothetical protein
MRTETLIPEGEVARLRWMIRYALDGPSDLDSYRTILNDALNGVRGGENAEEVRGQVEMLREQVRALGAVAVA